MTSNSDGSRFARLRPCRRFAAPAELLHAFCLRSSPFGSPFLRFSVLNLFVSFVSFVSFRFRD